mmetsp:Transcript_11905/g.35271  ORF Transcript_11905/g.35271 Transcript_11905/m.35271 type:complete len:286 (-) Transcript_11905:1415-2272(-)
MVSKSPSTKRSLVRLTDAVPLTDAPRSRRCRRCMKAFAPKTPLPQKLWVCCTSHQRMYIWPQIGWRPGFTHPSSTHFARMANSGRTKRPKSGTPKMARHQFSSFMCSWTNWPTTGRSIGQALTDSSVSTSMRKGWPGLVHSELKTKRKPRYVMQDFSGCRSTRGMSCRKSMCGAVAESCSLTRGSVSSAKDSAREASVVEGVLHSAMAPARSLSLVSEKTTCVGREVPNFVRSSADTRPASSEVPPTSKKSEVADRQVASQPRMEPQISATPNSSLVVRGSYSSW